MAGEKIIFSMEGVTKTYPPTKQVLKNIWLSFFYGAKIGVLGLNGSGKSTLLKIIAGLEAPDAGQVWLDGRDISALPPHRRIRRRDPVRGDVGGAERAAPRAHRHRGAHALE